MSRYFGLWAFVLLYVPSSQSMGRHSGLCAVISTYVPSSRPMCHHLILCAFILIYVPSSQSMDCRPHSMCRPPTAIVKSTIMCKLGYNVFSFLYDYIFYLR